MTLFPRIIVVCDTSEKKMNGGLGSRDLVAFNDALLAKQIWRLMKDFGSPGARILKAIYHPYYDILNTPLGPRPS